MQVITANMWSFWGKGWLFLPVVCGLDRKNNTQSVLLRECVRRFPELKKQSFYASPETVKRGLSNIYKLQHRRDGSETLVCHDTRIPTSVDDHGIVMFTPVELDDDSGQIRTTWELLNVALVNIRETVRPVLFRELFIPVMELGGVTREDFTDECEDVFKGIRNITLVINEDNSSFICDEDIVTPCDVRQDGYSLSDKPVETVKNENVSAIQSEFESIDPRR